MSYFKSILIFAALCITSVLAAPQLVQHNASVTDSDTRVLQFALILEHAGRHYYNQALEMFDKKVFADAGFEPWVRGRFEQIREHQQMHVDVLTQALGSDAPQPCTYNTQYDDPKSFVAFAATTEAFLSSTYISAVQHLQNKSIIRLIASILATKSRHAAWVASAVSGGSPWGGSFEFDTPISMDGSYSLISEVITSCPASNPELIAKTLPMLITNPANPPAGGEDMEFIFDHEKVKHDGQLYVAWFDGIFVRHTDLRDDNTAYVPKELKGMVYSAVVGSKETNPEKQELLTGLTMFVFDFPSSVPNP